MQMTRTDNEESWANIAHIRSQDYSLMKQVVVVKFSSLFSCICICSPPPSFLCTGSAGDSDL